MMLQMRSMSAASTKFKQINSTKRLATETQNHRDNQLQLRGRHKQFGFNYTFPSLCLSSLCGKLCAEWYDEISKVETLCLQKKFDDESLKENEE